MTQRTQPPTCTPLVSNVTEADQHKDSDDIDWESDPRHDTNIRRKTAQKYELFEPYVTEKSCLDIGCAGGGAGFVTDDYWLHSWLNDQSTKLVGIDVDEKGVRTAVDAGYDVRLASAEDFDLDETFKIVVAANVIEHLASPGEMLSSVRQHLEPDGRLLLTTPRTHTPWNLLRQFKNEQGIEPHPEHTMWFCRTTLTELLRRKGFKPVEYQSWGFNRVGMSLADSLWRGVERQLSKFPYLDEIDKYQHFVVAEPTTDS
jgi:2-polyprenyl-3-methyl-5-hydroxy-6-metoxy-1,4-benzoquinol methylase